MQFQKENSSLVIKVILILFLMFSSTNLKAFTLQDCIKKIEEITKTQRPELTSDDIANLFLFAPFIIDTVTQHVQQGPDDITQVKDPIYALDILVTNLVMSYQGTNNHSLGLPLIHLVEISEQMFNVLHLFDEQGFQGFLTWHNKLLSFEIIEIIKTNNPDKFDELIKYLSIIPKPSAENLMIHACLNLLKSPTLILMLLESPLLNPFLLVFSRFIPETASKQWKIFVEFFYHLALKTPIAELMNEGVEILANSIQSQIKDLTQSHAAFARFESEIRHLVYTRLVEGRLRTTQKNTEESTFVLGLIFHLAQQTTEAEYPLWDKDIQAELYSVMVHYLPEHTVLAIPPAPAIVYLPEHNPAPLFSLLPRILATSNHPTEIKLYGSRAFFYWMQRIYGHFNTESVPADTDLLIKEHLLPPIVDTLPFSQNTKDRMISRETGQQNHFTTLMKLKNDAYLSMELMAYQPETGMPMNIRLRSYSLDQKFQSTKNAQFDLVFTSKTSTFASEVPVALEQNHDGILSMTSIGRRFFLDNWEDMIKRSDIPVLQKALPRVRLWEKLEREQNRLPDSMREKLYSISFQMTQLLSETVTAFPTEKAPPATWLVDHIPVDELGFCSGCSELLQGSAFQADCDCGSVFCAPCKTTGICSDPQCLRFGQIIGQFHPDKGMQKSIETAIRALQNPQADSPSSPSQAEPPRGNDHSDILAKTAYSSSLQSSNVVAETTPKEDFTISELIQLEEDKVKRFEQKMEAKGLAAVNLRTLTFSSKVTQKEGRYINKIKRRMSKIIDTKELQNKILALHKDYQLKLERNPSLTLQDYRQMLDELRAQSQQLLAVEKTAPRTIQRSFSITHANPHETSGISKKAMQTSSSIFLADSFWPLAIVTMNIHKHLLAQTDSSDAATKLLVESGVMAVEQSAYYARHLSRVIKTLEKFSTSPAVDVFFVVNPAFFLATFYHNVEQQRNIILRDQKAVSTLVAEATKAWQNSVGLMDIAMYSVELAKRVEQDGIHPDYYSLSLLLSRFHHIGVLANDWHYVLGLIEDIVQEIDALNSKPPTVTQHSYLTKAYEILDFGLAHIWQKLQAFDWDDPRLEQAMTMASHVLKITKNLSGMVLSASRASALTNKFKLIDTLRKDKERELVVRQEFKDLQTDMKALLAKTDEVIQKLDTQRKALDARREEKTKKQQIKIPDDSGHSSGSDEDSAPDTLSLAISVQPKWEIKAAQARKTYSLWQETDKAITIYKEALDDAECDEGKPFLLIEMGDIIKDKAREYYKPLLRHRARVQDIMTDFESLEGNWESRPRTRERDLYAVITQNVYLTGTLTPILNQALKYQNEAVRSLLSSRNYKWTKFDADTLDIEIDFIQGSIDYLKLIQASLRDTHDMLRKILSIRQRWWGTQIANQSFHEKSHVFQCAMKGAGSGSFSVHASAKEFSRLNKKNEATQVRTTPREKRVQDSGVSFRELLTQLKSAQERISEFELQLDLLNKSHSLLRTYADKHKTCPKFAVQKRADNDPDGWQVVGKKQHSSGKAIKRRSQQQPPAKSRTSRGYNPLPPALQNHYQFHEIRGDGNCMYSALTQGLSLTTRTNMPPENLRIALHGILLKIVELIALQPNDDQKQLISELHSITGWPIEKIKQMLADNIVARPSQQTSTSAEFQASYGETGLIPLMSLISHAPIGVVTYRSRTANGGAWGSVERYDLSVWQNHAPNLYTLLNSNNAFQPIPSTDMEPVIPFILLHSTEGDHFNLAVYQVPLSPMYPGDSYGLLEERQKPEVLNPNMFMMLLSTILLATSEFK